MSKFTYEQETTGAPLERFEWDNVWWEHTENKDAKRVVYIGDSISCGTRHAATRVSGDTVLFDGFGTSKALDNPFYKEALSTFLRQEGKYDAVLFNNGLHGWHLSDEQYEAGYRGMIAFLRERTDKPLFLVLTTDTPANPTRAEIVLHRNAIVRKLSAELSLPLIDLYETAIENGALHAPDNVHFTEEGYEKLGAVILKSLAEYGV